MPDVYNAPASLNLYWRNPSKMQGTNGASSEKLSPQGRIVVRVSLSYFRYSNGSRMHVVKIVVAVGAMGRTRFLPS